MFMFYHEEPSFKWNEKKIACLHRGSFIQGDLLMEWVMTGSYTNTIGIIWKRAWVCSLQRKRQTVSNHILFGEYRSIFQNCLSKTLYFHVQKPLISGQISAYLSLSSCHLMRPCICTKRNSDQTKMIGQKDFCFCLIAITVPTNYHSGISGVLC